MTMSSGATSTRARCKYKGSPRARATAFGPWLSLRFAASDVVRPAGIMRARLTRGAPLGGRSLFRYHRGMSRLLVVFASLLALSAAACKAVEGDRAGPCGEEGLLLSHDAISPVRYGTSAAREPVVEIRFESRGTCRGESETHWLVWTDGAPSLTDPEDDLDTTTAELTYLTDLHLRAIHWREASLTMPFDRTQDIFTFSAIFAGEPIGDFKCWSDKGALFCGPASP